MERSGAESQNTEKELTPLSCPPTNPTDPLSTFVPEGGPPQPVSLSKTVLVSGSQVLSVGAGYELLKVLGQGGFGQVWKAKAPGGVEVAVKKIMRPLDHKSVQNELQALELIKQLRHPYLLQTHAFWSLEDQLVIVMELADGSLRDRLKECQQEGQTGIPVAELLRYFRETAEALDYLHSKSVQHRDIKPDNILVLQGHAKVGDFGLARLQAMEQSMTDPGSGTPPYIAPEIWLGRIKPNSDSDQYSLALTYFELRYNRRVIANGSLMQVMMAHTEGQYSLDPMPEAEQAVLRRALSRDPADRYPSCREFVRNLEQATGVFASLSGTAIMSPSALEGAPRGPASGDTARMGQSGSTTARAGDTNSHLMDLVAVSEYAPRHETSTTAVLTPTQPQRRWPLIAAAAVALVTVAGIGVWAVRDRLGSDAATLLPKEVDFLPEGYRKAADAIVFTDGGKRFYNRIERTLPGGQRVEFVLIPQNGTPPETFYILPDKVSVDLFRAFAATTVKFRNTGWERLPSNNKDGKYPVMGVSVLDASEFAKWLGGNLPTPSEWNKAAGSNEQEGRKGPYKEPGTKDTLSLSRNTADGPMRNREATNDHVDFVQTGVRVYDMASNGREWTRSILGVIPEFVPLQRPVRTDDRVLLGGASFRSAEPVKYENFADTNNWDSKEYAGTADDIGFRVVLEQ
jgi:serine/threonine protein kinase